MLHQTIGPYNYQCICLNSMFCIPNTAVLVLWWPQLVLLHFRTQDINELTQSIYIPRGVNTEALSRTASWDYQPEGFKVSCVYHEVAKWPFNYYHPTYASFLWRVSYWAFQKKRTNQKIARVQLPVCPHSEDWIEYKRMCFSFKKKNSHHSGFIAAQSILTSNEQMSIFKIK